ncbi:MAG: UDP-glucose 6-dehydrogenase [Kiritimatiellae bacterium]|nr:UDP-glucose 6-dehydrogenase [Kiritimatiellia bacterium]
MATVGIIGCGYIGSALKIWLEEHNPSVKIVVSDPPKGINDPLDGADVFFVSIHIPTEIDGSQDLSLLKEIIKSLPDKPVFVRTTILPGSSEMLTRETSHRVYFMPEFLTERTHIEDFRTQPMVFTAEVDLLKEIFKGKKYYVMSSLEAEITKYAHNVFGAVKVTYFNAVADYCRRLGCDYQKVRDGVLLSGYINATHTMVPGPDGKFGYGGKCFPKDVNALERLTASLPLGELIAPLKKLNLIFRGEDK